MEYLTGDGDKDCASTDTNPTRRTSATAEWDNPWYPYAAKPPKCVTYDRTSYSP